MPMARISASLEKGRFELDDMTMKVAGGGVMGHATLRRSGELATLAGSLTGDQIAVNRPGFAGRIGGTLEFASTGKNPLALIEGLAGSLVATTEDLAEGVAAFRGKRAPTFNGR